MDTLFEGFQILCTIFWKKGGIVFKGGHYLRKYDVQYIFANREDQQRNKTSKIDMFL